MHLNQDPIDVNQLEARLTDVFKTRAERVVFVKGDPDLDYQTVAHAIDIAKGAGKLVAVKADTRRFLGHRPRRLPDRTLQTICRSVDDGQGQ